MRLFCYVLKPRYSIYSRYLESICETWARLLDVVLRKSRLLYLTFVRENVLERLYSKYIIATRTLIYVESPIDIYNQLITFTDYVDIYRTSLRSLSCRYEHYRYFEDNVHIYATYVVEEYPHESKIPMVHGLLEEPYVRAVRLCLEYDPVETHKLEQLAYQLSTQAETARDYEHITDVLSDRQLGHILLRLTTCIVTYAHDPAEHDLNEKTIEARLHEHKIETRRIIGTPFKALYNMPRLDMDVLTSTRYIAEIAPPVSLELFEEDGLYIADLDIPEINVPIILNPFATHALVKLGRRSYRAVQHMLVIGMSGAGKSGLGVILAYRAKKHQNANLLIFDIKGTDYRKLTSRLGLETVRPSGLDPIALWSPTMLGIDATSAGLAAAGVVATLLDLQDRHMVNRLAAEVAAHYRTSREHGLKKLITEVRDNDVRELLEELYNTYHDYVSGETPRLGQDVVLSFDRVPDIGDPSRIENPKTVTLILALPLVLHYALRIKDKAYAIMDEAWRLLKLTHTQHMLELMFRTFRSLNIAIVFITQDYEDLYDSEIGHVLLNNSDIHVIMKQRSRRSIELLRRNYGIPETLIKTIYPETEVGTGILSTRGHLVPIKVKLFEEEWRLLPD